MTIDTTYEVVQLFRPSGFRESDHLEMPVKRPVWIIFVERRTKELVFDCESLSVLWEYLALLLYNLPQVFYVDLFVERIR